MSLAPGSAIALVFAGEMEDSSRTREERRPVQNAASLPREDLVLGRDDLRACARKRRFRLGLARAGRGGRPQRRPQDRRTGREGRLSGRARGGGGHEASPFTLPARARIPPRRRTRVRRVRVRARPHAPRGAQRRRDRHPGRDRGRPQILDALGHAHGKESRTGTWVKGTSCSRTGPTPRRGSSISTCPPRRARRPDRNRRRLRTPAYIAPERLDGAESAGAADVWAVGVILWEALAGFHPFQARLRPSTRPSGSPPRRATRTRAPRPARDLCATVDRMLALDSAPPSARRAAADLRSAGQSGRSTHGP